MFELFELSKLLTYAHDQFKKTDNLRLNNYAYEDTVDKSLLCLNFTPSTPGRIFLWQREFNHSPSYCWLPWFPYKSILSMCLDPTGRIFLWQREFNHSPSYCWLPWFPYKSILSMCLDPTGRIFLWQREFNHSPSYCWLPWFPYKSILSMCLDPTGSWLLTLCSDNYLYVLCVRTILEPGAKVDQLWRIDDITQICEVPSTTGMVSCIKWWKTMCGDNIVILATKVGFLVFIDIVSQQVVSQVDLNEYIVDIQLLHSDSFTETYVLISTKSNNQFRILIEEKLDVHFSVIQDSAYFPIQNQYRSIYSTAKNTDDIPECFKPKRIFQFPSHVQLSPQQAKGRCFIAAHDLKSNVYKIYGSGLDQGVLFMYKIPVDADNILYTDKLMFTSTYTDGGTLQVLANQFSEISGDELQEFPLKSCVQTFDLEPDERILCLYKKSYPHYWHEKVQYVRGKCKVSMIDVNAQGYTVDLESSEDNIKYQSHSVFDGCIVITTTGVYECKPRISPEHLYVSLSLSNAPIHQLETLDILVGVDMSYLAIQVAEQKLQCKQYSYADKLLTMAKCSKVQRCLIYAKFDLLDHAVRLSQELLHGNECLNTDTRKAVLDVCVKACVLQLLRTQDKKHTNILREVLLSQSSVLDSDIWGYLQRNNLHEVMWAVARSAGKVRQVVDLYIHNRSLTLNSGITADQDLAHTKWIRKHKGSLLDHLTGSDLISLLHHNPTVWTQLLDLMEEELAELDFEELKLVSQILDPAQSSVVQHLDTMLRYRDNLSCSPMWDKAVDLVMLFILTRLHLNYNDDKIHKTPVMSSDVNHKTCRMEVLQSTEGLLACSTYISAMVVDKKLYMWGRLGGNSVLDVLQDCRCSQIQMPGNTPVISVSCGYTFILVLTSYGLYSMGNNRFGELGLGHTQPSKIPQFIDSLKDQNIVQIDSGHYHNLALTEHGRVYSWGWGVHGQLGLCDINDVLSPREITRLNKHFVVRVQAGQAHSMTLTREGHVYVFGNNNFGQLGLNDTTKRSAPTKIQLNQPVINIATQYFHCVVLTNNQKLYEWGVSPVGLKQKMTIAKKKSGYKGSSSSTVTHEATCIHLSPRIVDKGSLGHKQEIEQLSCGIDFTLVVTSTGSVYSCGKNIDGQLGVGKRHTKNENRLVPVVKIGSVNIKQVVCGPDFVIAKDVQGETWGWGRNDYGQLGILFSDPTGMPSQSFVFPVQLTSIPSGKSLIKTDVWKVTPLSQDRAELKQLHSHSNQINGGMLQMNAYIKFLSPFINLHLVLNKATQLENYECAAYICDVNKRYGDAFMYRLKSLMTINIENSEILRDRVYVVLTDCLRKLKDSKDRMEKYHGIIQELFDWWTNHKQTLSTTDLEVVLSPHLKELSITVYTIISRFELSGTAKINFSAPFIMQLTDYVIANVKGCHNNQMVNKLKNEALSSTGNNPWTLSFGGEKIWHELVENISNTESLLISNKNKPDKENKEDISNIKLGENKCTLSSDTGQGVPGVANSVNSNEHFNKKTLVSSQYSIDSNKTKEDVKSSEYTDGIFRTVDNGNNSVVSIQNSDKTLQTANSNQNISAPDSGMANKESHKNHKSSDESDNNFHRSNKTVVVFSCGHSMMKSEWTVSIGGHTDQSDLVFSYYTRPGAKILVCPGCLYTVMEA